MHRHTGLALLVLMAVSRGASAEHHTARFFTSYGTAKEIADVKFSPNSELVAVAPKDGPVTILSTKTGDVVREVKFAPFQMCFSADGRKILAISSSQTKLLDVATGKDSLVGWRLPEGYVGCVYKQQAGKLLIDTLTQGGPAAATEKLHVGDELVAIIDRDAETSLLGRSVQDAINATVGQPGTPITLRMVSKENGKTVDVEVRRKSAVKVGNQLQFQEYHAGFAPDSFSFWSKGNVVLLDATAGSVLSVIKPEKIKSSGISVVSPDGRLLAIVAQQPDSPKLGNGNLGLEIFDVAKQERLYFASLDVSNVKSLRFIPNQKRLLLGCRDRVMAFDLEKGEFVASIFVGFDSELAKVKPSPDSSNQASGGTEQSGRSASPDAELSRRTLATFGGSSAGSQIEAEYPLLCSFDTSPDGQYVAVGNFDGTCCLWSAVRHERLAELGDSEKHENVTSTTISPDGKWVSYFVKGTLHIVSIKDVLKDSPQAKEQATSE